MEKWKQSGFIILLALFLTACGGGGGGGTPSAGGGGQVIGPNGGAKTSNDQKASVTIPAGALSEEKVVTVEKASNSPSGNIGDAYDFGPDGTTFNKPVTIQIAYDNASIPAGISALDLRLGKVANGQWETVAGSTVDTGAGRVSGTTSSFSVYGVVAGQPSSKLAYTPEDLAGTWYSMDINTPQKGFSNPDHFGFDFDKATLQSDGAATIECIASSDSCETVVGSGISISSEGVITTPLGPNEAENFVMGANKSVMAQIFRQNSAGEEHQVFAILVKKAASYSMEDLVGTWYDMSIDTPKKGFSDANHFGFSFETITIESDGSGVSTCVAASEPCDPPELFSGLSISSDGIITVPQEPNVVWDAVMGASKDIFISLFRDNNTGNEFHAFGVQVKKGASYSMADLAGTWYAININTPQTGISNPNHFGFDFDILTLQSDGTGTIACVASSDDCETEPITGVSVSSEGIVTSPLALAPGQEQNMVMGANKDIMVQIVRDNNKADGAQEFYILVKKAE